MSEALIQTAPLVTSDNFEGLVRDELGRIGEGFFRIGYYLNKARDERLYIPLGYDSLYEMSEDLFDLKESSVFNMMAVWAHFHDVKNPLALREDCRGLKYSQLIECLRDKWDSRCCVTRLISSTDTVKETKAKVSAWNALTGRLSHYPSLEQVEQYIEQKEEERKTEQNSKRLESVAPELVGQLPGQTSIFVEGIAEEPFEENSKRLEFSEEETPPETVDVAPIGAEVDGEEPSESEKGSKRLESSETDPFAGLPGEAGIYAQGLVKDSRAESNEYGTVDIIPAEIQMRIHKRQAISYVEDMSLVSTAENVERFFENAIKRLVAMRAYKLKMLKENAHGDEKAKKQ